MNFFSILTKPLTCTVVITAALPLFGLLLSPVPAEAAPSKAQAAPKKLPAAAPTTSSKGKPAMPLFPVFALDVPSTHQPFSVYLNGWLLDSSDGGPQAYFSSSKIGIYVADGTNTLTLHILPTAHSYPVLSPFQVRIRSTDGEVFYYLWDPSNPTEAKRPLPFTTQKHFTAHLPHSWAWQTAPKITLDAPTKQAINAHIKEMFDALNTKNVDKATALFLLEGQEGNVARNIPVVDAEAPVRTQWKQNFAIPNWHMLPINYATLTYDLIGDGRVVNVSGPGDTYVLVDAGKNAAFDINLSLINGQWTQVR